MADGNITFKTELDNSDLEKQLKDAERKVEQLKRKIESSEGKRSAIEAEMDDAKRAIESASAATERLRSELESLRNVDPTDQTAYEAARAKAEQLAESLKKAEAHELELAKTSESLDKKWAKANDEVKQHNAALESAQKRAARLGREYAQSYSQAGNAISRSVDSARAAFDRFASRVSTMLKRVFVFGVMLKGIRSVVDALKTALSQNMRFSASWEGLKATIQGVANAIANMVAPAITGLVNGTIAAIQSLAQAVDSMFGTGIMDAIRSAQAASQAAWRQTDASIAAQKAAEKAANATNKQAKAAKKLADEEKKAAKTLLAFDEINAMQAETAEDVADAFDDEGDDVGGLDEIADPASLMKPDWNAFDVGKIDAKLAEIMLILGAALLAVGAILAFSGINIPLGITLMMIGALMIYTAYKEQWDKLPAELQQAITAALVITGIVLLVLGAIIALSGINPPLGVGMMVAGALMLWTAVALNWGSMSAEMQATVSVLMGILGLALIVIGAILTFSGANPALGIALMIVGAVSMAAAVALNWDSIPPQIQTVVTAIMVMLGAALLVVGIILCLTGTAVPLGLGLMAVGAIMLGTAAALNWDYIQSHVDEVLSIVELAVSAALLVIGFVLVFTSANVPLGLGLLAVGAVTLGKWVAENWDNVPDHIKQIVNDLEGLLGAAALVVGAVLVFSHANVPLGLGLMATGAFALGKWIVENWDKLPNDVKGTIAVIETAVAAALLTVGIILAFSMANIPLGIGLLAMGALAMGHAITQNWDKIPNDVKGTIGTIETAVGAAFLTVGAILAFSTANIPLGIALLAAGALAMGHAMKENWQYMPDKVKTTIAIIEATVGSAALVVGAILTFTAVNIPLGVALMAAGALALAHLAAVNWQMLPQNIRDTVTNILGIVGTALVVIGVILCFTGVALPIGIGCIAAGAASLAAAAAINWNFIVDKVREQWEALKAFWRNNIAQVFTWDFWAGIFKSLVNGLIWAINNGLNAFGGFLNDLAGGVQDILNFFGVSGGTFRIGMPQIPYLAQGAVIPPNRKFMAVLGDQTSGTNIETPESLMRQVVREEAGAMIAESIRVLAESSGFGQQQRGGDVVFTIGARELARVSIEGILQMQQTGEVGSVVFG